MGIQELASHLQNMIEWLDDGNRQLSESCAEDVRAARAALAEAVREGGPRRRGGMSADSKHTPDYEWLPAAAAPELLISAICDDELSKDQPDEKVFKAHGMKVGESWVEFCNRLRRAAIAKATKGEEK
jgi:hypothetical protein